MLYVDTSSNHPYDAVPTSGCACDLCWHLTSGLLRNDYSHTFAPCALPPDGRSHPYSSRRYSSEKGAHRTSEPNRQPPLPARASRPPIPLPPHVGRLPCLRRLGSPPGRPSPRPGRGCPSL